MRVKELVETLLKQDQNKRVIMEISSYDFHSRTVVSSQITDVRCKAGGSLDKDDNEYYGVVLEGSN